VGLGNAANCGEGESISADASRATERTGLCGVTTTDTRTAREHIDPHEASTTDPTPDPPCGRERRPPRRGARRRADLMGRTGGLDVVACARFDPSALLRGIPSPVEAWRALSADRVAAP
jgi:hypothetical protein